MVTQAGSGESHSDPSGRRIKEGVPPDTSGMIAALRAVLGIPDQAQRAVQDAAPPSPATACLEAHWSGDGSTVINIQITVNVNGPGGNGPYPILGAFFSGDMFGPEATEWSVLEGTIGQSSLVLAAERVPPQPASELTLGEGPSRIEIFGVSHGPLSYGCFFVADGVPDFSHPWTVLFKGWQACS